MEMSMINGGRIGKGLAAVWTWVLVTAAPTLACPLCKDAIAGDPKAAVLSWTTLLMIAVPFALVGAIGTGIVYVHWRAARDDALEHPDPAASDAPWFPTLAERENES
jgi:hypothetical protein